MKVVHVGPKNYPPSHGGTERVVYNIVSNSEDIESHIMVEFSQKEQDKISVLPKSYLKRLRFILNYVKEKEIDIVHFHNETYIPLALLYSFFNKKNVVTIHGCHFTNPKYNFIQRFFILFFDIVGATILPRLVFCSEVDKNKFSKLIPFRKLYYVPNGVEIPMLNITNNDDKINSIVYLGRISPEKNLLLLIDEADKAKVSLHIYGAFDDRRPKFNELVKKALRNSEYAVWKGSVNYSEVISTLNKYDTFIYPSVSEGLPMSVLEAASSGLKLILSDIPQHKVLNFPSVNYIKTNSFSLSELSNDIDGNENKKYVEVNFSIDRMVNEYKVIYKSLLYE